MSDARRWCLIVAVAFGSLTVLPDTHSWVILLARPFLLLLALSAIAPWRGDE